MDESKPKGKESIDKQLIEEIYQLNVISLGEGAATCQVCGASLREGAAVRAYVFRPAGTVRYQVGAVVCDADEHALPEIFTLGVREALVGGRIGVCSDVGTQSWCQLLIHTDIRAVSPASSKSARTCSNTTHLPHSPAAPGAAPAPPKSPAGPSPSDRHDLTSQPDVETAPDVCWSEQQ